MIEEENMEIERRFLVGELPDLSNAEAFVIEQFYITVGPVLRLRRSNDKYFFTYKSGHGLVRKEEEFEISKEDYDSLSKKTIGNGVFKTRYHIPLSSGYTAELDVYSGRHKGLVVVEVEFPDVEKANEFTPPEWFGKEITGDRRYSNAMLALGSWPFE